MTLASVKDDLSSIYTCLIVKTFYSMLLYASETLKVIVISPKVLPLIISIISLAFSTIIAGYYYGENSLKYLSAAIKNIHK